MLRNRHSVLFASQGSHASLLSHGLPGHLDARRHRARCGGRRRRRGACAPRRPGPAHRQGGRGRTLGTSPCRHPRSSARPHALVAPDRLPTLLGHRPLPVAEPRPGVPGAVIEVVIAASGTSTPAWLDRLTWTLSGHTSSSASPSSSAPGRLRRQPRARPRRHRRARGPRSVRGARRGPRPPAAC